MKPGLIFHIEVWLFIVDDGISLGAVCFSYGTDVLLLFILLTQNRFLLKNNFGNSLVVQWLGLRAFTAGGPGSVPGQGAENPASRAVRPKYINK